MSGGALSVEHRLRCRAEDAYRWFQTRASFLDEGAGGAWYGTSTDIDDLKRLHERQRVLLGELQHRTRNLLAVVASVAHQTLDTSPDLRAFESRFDERLAALSRVQGLLFRTEQEAVTLRELVHMELMALGAEAAAQRAIVEGPEVALPASAVQTLALALHELATNALKHGALATSKGRLEVRWRTADEGSRQRLLLDWLESGVERAREMEAAPRRGFGRHLIERALPYQLQARTAFQLEADTLRCSIDLPLSTAPSATGAGGLRSAPQEG
jgi:two-component system CheB/CheR fusion protein